LSYLVDTNVISELRKGARTHPEVAGWFARVSSGEIYLSVLTIGEIRKGIEKKRARDHAAAAALERWLRTVLDLYADHILPVDRAVAERWGRLNSDSTLPILDSLLAATAAENNLVLVTRNVKDIERTGVAFLNPFSPPPAAS